MARRPDQAEASPESRSFWPQFWFYICRYSEYYFMLLVLLTVFAVLNGMAMLIGAQGTASFVVSVMVFLLLGITAAGTGGVLYQCRKLRVPESRPGEADD